MKKLYSSVLALGLMVSLSGCGPEGEGTIKISDPNAARAKLGGAEAVRTKKPLPSGAAKVKEQEQNAPTKHFQRG